MSAVTRASTLHARPSSEFPVQSQAFLAGARYPVGLLDDQRTIIYRYTGNQLGVSQDNGVTITAGKAFTANWTFRGGIETPAGEFLATIQKSAAPAAPGELWRSTGWNRATGDATSWTKVLTLVGESNYIRPEWGFSVAPSWSRHAGTIFAAEYGTSRLFELVDPNDAALRVYRSADDGLTWEEILDIRDVFVGETRIHVHGCAYDPWAGRLFVSTGDLSTGDDGICGVLYTDDPDKQNPSWLVVPGTQNPYAEGSGQVTAMLATEAGLVMTSDAPPHGIRILPRKAGDPGFGVPRQVLVVGGSAGGYIGTTLHRNGGLESPQPGAPLVACFQEPGNVGVRPAMFVSYDGGVRWTSEYRHATAISAAGSEGVARMFGPTTSGRFVGSVSVANQIEQLVLDWYPRTEATRDSPAQFAATLWQGRTSLTATPSSPTTLNEGGNASASGTSAALARIEIDPNVHDRLSLEVQVTANDVALGGQITANLDKVTAAAGASGALPTLSYGSTVLSVSTTPTAGLNPVVSASGAAPGAGSYVVRVTFPTFAAGAAVHIKVVLRGRPA